jgi:hypothetical protein
LNSAAYFAAPVTLARPSAREMELPIYAMASTHAIFLLD